MANTPPTQSIENLSTWLTSTNANIHEVLQSVNYQRGLLIIKVCRKKTKRKEVLKSFSFLIYRI